MDIKLDTEVREELKRRKGDWLAISAGSEVSYSWMSKFVNGHIDNPGLATLRKLAQHLKLGKKPARIKASTRARDAAIKAEGAA